jgi:hypothetical protein
MLRRLSFFVPYTAVAAAGASNLILTRKGEMDNGIAVESEVSAERVAGFANRDAQSTRRRTASCWAFPRRRDSAP